MSVICSRSISFALPCFYRNLIPIYILSNRFRNVKPIYEVFSYSIEKYEILSYNKSMDNIFKDLRKAKQLTQKELADIFNVDQTTVSKWEVGKALPDYGTLQKLADFYNVSIDYLLGRDEKMSARFPTDISELEADLRKVNFPVDEWMQLTDEQKHILLSTIENFIKSNK